MSRPPISPTEIIRMRPEGQETGPDLLVTEEPMEIRLSYGSPPNRKQKSISVTMRTPGNDFELAIGFLRSEGIIGGFSEVQEIRYCLEVKDPAEEGNVVLVYLKPEVEVDLDRLERHFYTTSSCGVCGKTSIDAVGAIGCAVFPNVEEAWLTAELVHRLPELARAGQTVFKHTGGIHAATLFDAEGNLLLQREDVGRHNAVDKLVGSMLAEEKEVMESGSEVPSAISNGNRVLLVSGRAGFELVQKTIAAGIPVMASVGAPSSLAVKLAKEFDLTLLGFVREGRFNVYHDPGRLI